jgi:hypothetical protein
MLRRQRNLRNEHEIFPLLVLREGARGRVAREVRFLQDYPPPNPLPEYQEGEMTSGFWRGPFVRRVLKLVGAVVV